MASRASVRDLAAEVTKMSRKSGPPNVNDELCFAGTGIRRSNCLPGRTGNAELHHSADHTNPSTSTVNPSGNPELPSTLAKNSSISHPAFRRVVSVAYIKRATESVKYRVCCVGRSRVHSRDGNPRPIFVSSPFVLYRRVSQRICLPRGRKSTTPSSNTAFWIRNAIVQLQLSRSQMKLATDMGLFFLSQNQTPQLLVKVNAPIGRGHNR